MSTHERLDHRMPMKFSVSVYGRMVKMYICIVAYSFPVGENMRRENGAGPQAIGKGSGLLALAYSPADEREGDHPTRSRKEN